MSVDEWTMFWTAVQACGAVVAILVAAGAFWFSVLTFKRSVYIQHYDGLDQLYAELLRDALGRPFLRNPASIQSEEEKAEYDNYAYMVWNFIETVYDRIGKNKKLHETWRPVINFETNLHLEWFQREENAAKFKQKFRDYAQCLLDPSTDVRTSGHRVCRGNQTGDV